MASATRDNPRDFEHTLALPNNRQLHYASAGNPSSTIVILFFSGYFSIDAATNASLPRPIKSLGAHYIAPTFPGNGTSSSCPKNIPYHINLCHTITALLEHLHPSDNSKDNAITRLYIGGGSYGTVPAQMLFGAPFDVSPQGRKIAGMVLAAPFSPFKYHKGYAKTLTWQDWCFVGPLSQWVPFRIVPRMLRMVIARRCKDIEGARKLLDMALFDKMDVVEKRRFEEFAKEERGISGEELKMQMAEGALRCTANWDGFLEGPDVLHSNWGFEPAKLDEEHVNKNRMILVMIGNSDDLGSGMAKWLVQTYKSATLKTVEGGHLAAMYHFDSIWAEVLPGSSVLQKSGVLN